MSTNGTSVQPLAFRAPEIRVDAAAADLESALTEFERIDLGLHGVLTIVDSQPSERFRDLLLREARAFAKFVLADIQYVRDLNGGRFTLTKAQLERLEAVEDSIDDVVDTLDWSLQARDELRELISEERAP
jgi:hypothetical protein